LTSKEIERNPRKKVILISEKETFKRKYIYENQKQGDPDQRDQKPKWVSSFSVVVE